MSILSIHGTLLFNSLAMLQNERFKSLEKENKFIWFSLIDRKNIWKQDCERTWAVRRNKKWKN